MLLMSFVKKVLKKSLDNNRPIQKCQDVYPGYSELQIEMSSTDNSGKIAHNTPLKYKL